LGRRSSSTVEQWRGLRTSMHAKYARTELTV
jgi:hypothetical protein